jgi:hypothetical protein
MKISIENILGSARRVSGQRQGEESGQDKGRREVRTDSVDIQSRIDTRITTIQTELRDIQSSLTRNQIVSDGLRQLGDDISRGGQNTGRILDEVRFEGQTVLRAFAGDRVSPESVKTGRERVTRLLNDDINSLRKLQVEAENMLAAGATGTGAIDDIMGNIEGALSRTDAGSLDGISSLNADTVRRLVR